MLPYTLASPFYIILIVYEILSWIFMDILFIIAGPRGVCACAHRYVCVLKPQ